MTRRAFRRAVLVALLLLAALLFAPSPPPPETGWLGAAGLAPEHAVVDGVDVRFVRRGEGPAVVLLHGFASSIYTWKDVIGPLARGRQVIAFDFPGFGASAIPDPLDSERLPATVLGLMDALGAARATLVGNSLGGAVAVAVAARHPERVERLVLVDAAGFNFASADRPLLLRAVGSPAGAVLEYVPVRSALFAAGLRQVFHDQRLVTEERVAEYVRPYRRKGSIRASRQVLARAGGLGFPGVVEAVRAPTLVVWGREDRWIPVEHAARFARAIPGAQVAVLDACGHLPQEEKPRELVARLEEFLR
jgi:pimeloyl-ACP methyl ester carboxylesterase